ncbi:phosphopantothenate--cysteine ligase [Planctomycetes bacterium Pan216]|uniref:Phosphopantothenate--cysteine ligase n=1 Tax=Kolteria novifilia TaxID=2527975 RepID=A0A518B588_9BACT|nr:phosphopantothenate--cysteine ligase [Planctomycetes bacterium Pan216]
MMRVLVTAGGTRARVDDVRWIGNSSTGRFGARIVRELLGRGAKVVHLASPQAEMPLARTIDFAGAWEDELGQCREASSRWAEWATRYREERFDTPDDYGERLRELLRREAFDMVVLAAAVSDYAPMPTTGKISSREDELTLRLRRVPKFIAQARDWAPKAYLVGFKLLSGVAEEHLVDVARDAGRANRVDVTVANDWRLLQSGCHTIHLVRDGEATETFSERTVDIADRLVDRLWCWAEEKRRG